MIALRDNLYTRCAAPRSVVVGLGRTGLSCARHLAARGHSVVVTDSRGRPPALEALRKEVPEAEVRLAGLDEGVLEGAKQLLVSPGVSLDEPLVRAARARGIAILGDIDLFAAVCDAPVVAVTGSNGKSTVTTMLAHMLSVAGVQARAGGNLGEPALDLLRAGDRPDFYVLELSSFQLERTESLPCAAAAVLNISADHIDRHGDLAAYTRAKARIYAHCEIAVVNRCCDRVCAMVEPDRRQISFGLAEPPASAYGIHGPSDPARISKLWLARGRERLMKASELRCPGLHMVGNALAALALGEAVSLPRAAMLSALREYRGLPHRGELVAEARGVSWINDSKATNVGAAVAAVSGLPGPLVLIAGGDAKGGDFAPLAAALHGKSRAAILLGRDAPRLEAALGETCVCYRVAGMEEAVAQAAALCRAGDTVLLSPACASQDMFEDFEARGDAFAAAVRGGLR